jgi:hypothetical protein
MTIDLLIWFWSLLRSNFAICLEVLTLTFGRQFRGQQEEPTARRRVHTNAPVPDRKHIYADIAKLFLKYLANVEAGFYPVPADHDGSLLALIHRSRMFFEDLPNVPQRRQRRGHQEILNETTRGTRPRYYLQNGGRLYWVIPTVSINLQSPLLWEEVPVS